MYNVIKQHSLATFFFFFFFFLGGGGGRYFRGSLFSGFIRSHKVLTLLSEGSYYRNFTVNEDLKTRSQSPFEIRTGNETGPPFPCGQVRV